MRHFLLREIIDLVVAGVPDADTRIQQMFEWHFQRVTSISQWFLGATATLFVSVLVAFFRGELQLAWWQSVFIVVLALAPAGYAAYRLRELRLLSKEFVAALRLHSDLKGTSPFLIRYRGRRTW